MQEKLNYCPKWRESWTINFSIFFWGGGGGGFSSLPPTCRPKNVHSCRCGVSGGSSARRPGSQDPHRRERNLGHFFFLSCPVSILRKRLFVVFQNLAWAPKSQKILGFQPTKNPPPPSQRPLVFLLNSLRRWRMRCSWSSLKNMNLDLDFGIFINGFNFLSTSG